MRQTVGWAAWVLAGTAVAFDGQSMRYQVDWGPLTLANLDIRWLDAGSIRSVEVEVSSRGVGAWFGSFQSDLEIIDTPEQGVLLNGNSRWDEGLSQLTVNWLDAETAPTVDYFRSTPRDYDITPVPEASTAGTVHPFAPVFTVAQALEEHGRCEGEFPVFDGIRRYDVVIQDQGDVVLSAETEGEYSGPAHVCEIAVRRLGGFSSGRRWFHADESDLKRTLYFGQVGTHWLPVRFEIQAPVGQAVARWMAHGSSMALAD